MCVSEVINRYLLQRGESIYLVYLEEHPGGIISRCYLSLLLNLCHWNTLAPLKIQNTTHKRQFWQTDWKKTVSNQFWKSATDNAMCCKLGVFHYVQIFQVHCRVCHQKCPLKARISGWNVGGTLTTPSSQFSMGSPLYQQWVKALHYTIGKKWDRQYCETSISLCGFFVFSAKNDVLCHYQLVPANNTKANNEPIQLTLPPTTTTLSALTRHDS